ncbi:Sec-independent protein translocase protein TatB [Arcobacter sp. L]|jgi:sec-independent protein translocase protein TatB|uniref:Sec-independent protein translocase protein TatB n=2 Tax=unclassified Arcobacter TaxID=2593671 RepID=UPI002159F0D1|nr:Sec-independent protein translocase protein TatB [Arcobacter sp. L]
MELQMFGMGFMEILLIAIIAVIALGPDKLPEAMVQIAKFINKFKTGLADAKSTLDNELNISEMKSEANKFKSQIEETKASLSLDSKIDLGLNEILKDDLKDDSIKEKTEKVSFKKENKSKEKLDNKEENA